MHRIAREPDCRGAVKRGLTVFVLHSSVGISRLSGDFGVSTVMGDERTKTRTLVGESQVVISHSYPLVVFLFVTHEQFMAG